MLSKFKATKLYNIFFIRAFKQNPIKVKLLYFLCLGLVALSILRFSSYMTEYKPLEQLKYTTGIIERIEKQRKANPPKLYINNNGRKEFFVIYLNDIYRKDHNLLINKKAKVWFVNQYVLWPFIKDKRVLHLEVEGAIVENYDDTRKNLIASQKTTKNFLIFSFTFVLISLIRIWIKHNKI